MSFFHSLAQKGEKNNKSNKINIKKNYFQHRYLYSPKMLHQYNRPFVLYNRPLSKPAKCCMHCLKFVH